MSIEVDAFLKAFSENFSLICQKCGDRCVMGIERGINYGGQTGYQQGLLSVGCNQCKDHDLHLDL